MSELINKGHFCDVQSDFLFLHVHTNEKNETRRRTKFVCRMLCICCQERTLYVDAIKKRLHASLPFLHWAADEGNILQIK